MLPDPRPYFEELSDPRRETRNKLHKLHDILMIVLSAVLSGIEDWVGMEMFAQDKEPWLREEVGLELAAGIPSHDTLSDVMGRIDPQASAQAFTNWVKAALPQLGDEHVAVDGKTLRGSRDAEGAVHLVSAFAARARLVLAQRQVSEKSNEITAIPTLLDMLELKAAVVSADAMGCQKEIASKIVECGADYVLALKDNHRELCEDVTLWLDSQGQAGRLDVHHDTPDKDHGRIEVRRYALSRDIDWLEQKPQWAGLKAVGMVESQRHVGECISTERRYYLCSIDDVQQFARVVRDHWSIENSQHWVLDVQFGEDANRSRKDHSAANLALVRRMALNLLRTAESSKRSLRLRKSRACLNDEYRYNVLFGKRQT